MIKYLTVAVAAFVAVFAAVGSVAAGDSFGARLRGVEEVPSISTPGQGFFFASLNDAETQLDYQLIYFNVPNTVTQSHIHIGQTSVSGGIVLYLCTNLTPPANVPAPQSCPNGPGFQSITGSLTASNVFPQAGQGIAAGAFSDVIRAIKAGYAYANVHSSAFPSGEIRGQITH